MPQVRVCGQQGLEHRDAAGDAGDQPGCVVLVVEGVRVRPERDEDPRDVGPVVGRGQQQGSTPSVTGRLQVGAGTQGERHAVGVAGGRGGEQPPVRLRLVDRSRLVLTERLLQGRDLTRIPLAAGVVQRRHAVPLGRQPHVGTPGHEDPHGVVVGRRALAEDDRLVQGGPAQPVHVVDLDAGLDQPADDAGMPPLARADQPGPVEAVLARHVTAVGQGEVEQVEVALARRDEVGALLGVVLGVDVRAPGDQVAGGGDVVGPRGVAEALVEVGLCLRAAGGRSGGGGIGGRRRLRRRDGRRRGCGRRRSGRRPLGGGTRGRQRRDESRRRQGESGPSGPVGGHQVSRMGHAGSRGVPRRRSRRSQPAGMPVIGRPSRSG